MRLIIIELIQYLHRIVARIMEEMPVVLGGARGVMVIVVGNGHGDTSSNPGRD